MIYSIRINSLEQDPDLCCEYITNNLKNCNWDKMPIFSEIQPCAFFKGKNISYLNKNNFFEFLDLSVNKDIPYDIMIEFPYFGFQIYKDFPYIYVNVTNEYNKKYFNYSAFSRNKKSDLRYFYQGAYKGFIDADNKLRSIPNVKPTAFKTINEFRQAAHNQGNFYEESLFSHITAIQCLYLIKYKNLNGQKILGKGYTEAPDGDSTSSNTLITGTTALKGMDFGDTNNGLVSMKLFGIEDFWGNIWEWVDGIYIDGDYNVNVNNKNINIKKDIIFRKPANAPHGFIKNIFGTNDLGFIPNEWVENNIGYWSNYGCLFPNSVLHFGDRWSSKDKVGPFRFGFHGDGNVQHRTFGGRLCYH